MKPAFVNCGATSPLETELIDVGGKAITIPTIPEMLRTKGWMILSRNTARDYIDFAALAKHLGTEHAAHALEDFDSIIQI